MSAPTRSNSDHLNDLGDGFSEIYKPERFQGGQDIYRSLRSSTTKIHGVHLYEANAERMRVVGRILACSLCGSRSRQTVLYTENSEGQRRTCQAVTNSVEEHSRSENKGEDQGAIVVTSKSGQPVQIMNFIHAMQGISAAQDRFTGSSSSSQHCTDNR